MWHNLPRTVAGFFIWVAGGFIIFFLSTLFEDPLPSNDNPYGFWLFLFFPSLIWFGHGASIGDFIYERDYEGVKKGIIVLLIASSIIPIILFLQFLFPSLSFFT